MVTVADYGEFETAWCPGCGNFSIRKAVINALVSLGHSPHEVLFVSGIGQAAKAPHYLRANVFNGLHGRSLPAAQGAGLANPRLTVIAESGMGAVTGEGGNHFLAALRRNVDMTLLAPRQPDLRADQGPGQPNDHGGAGDQGPAFGRGVHAVQPIAVSVAMRAGFVARGFSGDIGHLSGSSSGPCGIRALPGGHFAAVRIVQQGQHLRLVQGTGVHAWPGSRPHGFRRAHGQGHGVRRAHPHRGDLRKRPAALRRAAARGGQGAACPARTGPGRFGRDRGELCLTREAAEETRRQEMPSGGWI